ncbi:MAG: Gldg family protein, partial [Planctomycetota bacterium]
LAVTGAANPNRRPEKILSIMKLNSANNCFNTESPITAELGEVSTVFSGVLKTLDQDETTAQLTHVPLLMTSEEGNSWSIENPYELMNPNYGEFLRRFRDGTEPVVMAYRVTGNFKSAFPEGIVVADDAAAEEADESDGADAPPMRTLTGLTEAAESGSVIVVADVDFMGDMVAYQRTFFGIAPVGDNSTFVLNALESLSGSDRLISIRSRGNYERPFTVVTAIETKAEEETLEETRAIEAQVKGFETQLNEKLQSLGGDNVGALINQTIVEEKKEIELQLRDAEKRLRDIKMQKRKRVEALKEKMRFYCTIPGPICVLGIAIALGIYRSVKRKHYISHASDS